MPPRHFFLILNDFGIRSPRLAPRPCKETIIEKKETKALLATGTVVFRDFPMYAGLDAPNQISYTIEEKLAGNWVRISDAEWISLDGLTKYTGSVSRVNRTWTIENTFSWMQDKVDVPVEKLWKDEGTRPDSVTLGLFRGDVKLAETTLTAADWKGKFADLPLRDDSGAVIDYSSCVVKEKSADTWIAPGGVVILDGKSYVFK